MHLRLTPFPDINEALAALESKIRGVLEQNLLGVYVVGSLALGDFDPAHSDIDIIVVTGEGLPASRVDALKTLHQHFASEPSPWARKLEVVYAPRAALRVPFKPLPGHVPQLEKGTELFIGPLEDGWVFQCWTLRERGLVVSGPDTSALAIVTPRAAMAEAVRAVAAQWLDDVEHDPTWLPWLRERENHGFVVQTLCRLLYSLKTGEVTSKPHALAWGAQTLGEPWASLVTTMGKTGELEDETVAATLAFIRYTYEAGRRELET